MAFFALSAAKDRVTFHLHHNQRTN